MDIKDLPLYVKHPGTVKISSTTQPMKAAWCALAFLEEKRENVEFLFIGASAGQQAHKSIGILIELFEAKWAGDFVILFRPMRFKTVVQSDSSAGREVDAQVWRVYVLDLKLISK